MLCYRGLNDDALAGREERLYLRFKADEASRAITGAFALQHPEDNNEAQPIHEHVSVVLEEGREQYAGSSVGVGLALPPSGLPHVDGRVGQAVPLHPAYPGRKLVSEDSHRSPVGGGSR